MARSVWRKYRHKYMSMCAAKTSTCPREEQKWVHVDMWSWPSTIFCAISSLSTFTAPASPDRLQIPKLILSPLFVCKRMLYHISFLFVRTIKMIFKLVWSLCLLNKLMLRYELFMSHLMNFCQNHKKNNLNIKDCFSLNVYPSGLALTLKSYFSRKFTFWVLNAVG